MNPDQQDNVSGYDIVWSVIAWIFSAMLSMVMSVFAINYFIMFVEYLNFHFRMNASNAGPDEDGFRGLGVLLVFAVAFVPVSCLFFKVLKPRVLTVVSLFRGKGNERR